MPKPSTPEANAAMAQSRGGRVATPESLRRGRARPNIDFLIGKRVAHAATSPAYERKSSDPVYRPLRIYALDPSASTADGAHSVVNVPYEPLELGPHGINVNCVAPGIVAGDRMDRLCREKARRRGWTPEQVHEEYVHEMALRRVTTADDIAAAVLFLSSEESRNMTGQCLTVDGGWMGR